MGSNCQKETGEIKFWIETGTYCWMVEEYMTAIIIVVSALSGIAFGGLYYLSYIGLKELLMTFPYNYIVTQPDGVVYDPNQ